MKKASGTSVETTARPFLKWAGGKTQLLAELVARIALHGEIRGYHEPFVGGGALFFFLYSSHLLPPRRVFLSDNNVNLLEAYWAVRDHVEDVVAALKRHHGAHSEEHYYEVRAAAPKTPVTRAARVIYLNKTCFNGLYRENSRGEFNVPMGSYKNPLICDETNLRAASRALQTAKITQQHFRDILKTAKKGDFVYFDPPYWPLSATSNFTAYAKGSFTKTDQEELAEVFAELTRRGVKALLSNSDAPLIHELYSKFRIERVYANRNVNSKPERRGKLTEVLVRNY